MKKNLLVALWFTLVTTVIFGVLYPLAVTGLAQVRFHERANGQLIEKAGKLESWRDPESLGRHLPVPAIFTRAIRLTICAAYFTFPQRRYLKFRFSLWLPFDL